MDEKLKKFGEYLDEFSQSKGYSGEKFADACGFAKQTYSNMRHGKNFKIKNIFLILEAFPDFSLPHAFSIRKEKDSRSN
ncbi:MAG: helix-turn-helix transcriptional regulator [Weeksellaceae bacterium]|nr:helix-turn-helix transcriptional regulator [Weeksellaceae bacterium]